MIANDYSTLLCRVCSGTVNYCLPPLSVSHEPRKFTTLRARISCQDVDKAFRWSALRSSSVSWLPQYHSVHDFIFASVAMPCKLKSSNLDDTRCLFVRCCLHETLSAVLRSLVYVPSILFESVSVIAQLSEP